jgi:hypothetical protein
MDRRIFLTLPGLAAAASTPSATALCLNEDPNHFFASRADRRVTKHDLTQWVDQYAGTQVKELMLCVNAQRTAFASGVWNSFWDGYDPKGPDDQPLFASQPPAARKFMRAWVHQAWQMHQDGLDLFAHWVPMARQRGLSPFLSVRMNDLHNVEDEKHSLHSTFWKSNPQFRRAPHLKDMRSKALDFLHAEVRDYTFSLLEEIVGKYQPDGLELDWMRHGFHLAPGREEEGRSVLTAFMRRTRRLLGSGKKLAVRVPSRPETAYRLGLDVRAWAQEGCADLVTVTNFWRTTDNQMPIRWWRELLPKPTLLAAGLELGLNPYPASQPFERNTIETVRGSAAAFLQEGADRIYLFNYMDSQTAIDDLSTYPALLRECGALSTIGTKRRRHVFTYQDTWAPGETVAVGLPARLEAGQTRTFRLPTGPRPSGQSIRLSLACEGPAPRAFVNGSPIAEAVPESAMRDGDTIIDLVAAAAVTVHRVEISIG